MTNPTYSYIPDVNSFQAKDYLRVGLHELSNGSFVNVSPATPLPVKEFYQSIAEGEVPGYSVVTVFGRNRDLDPAEQTLIWDYGPTQALEVLLSADTELFVSSTDAGDVNVGILIEGMTDDYLSKIELHMHTTGQTQHSMGVWFRIFKMTVVAGDSALGDLYIAEADTLTDGAPDTSAKVHGYMVQNTGTTHKASGTVPAGHTLYVNRLFLGVRRGEDCVFSFYVKPPGFPDFIEASDFPVYQGTLFENFGPPFPVTEKIDWEMRGLTVTNNTQASANIGAILVDNLV